VTTPKEPANKPSGKRPEEFEAFEDLMTKLVSVPKREVDEKVKEAKKRRAAKP
jgi:hypothetical protein